MKRFILAGFGLCAMAAVQPAAAADMPVKAPVFKAPVAVMDPWTGLYAGLNAGYSWGPWDSNNPAGLANFPGSATALSSSASPHVNGVIGGVQLGYNWLLQKNWLVGVEGDFQWSGEKDSLNGTAAVTLTTPDFRFVFTGTSANDWKMKWFSTLRARTGFVTADQWLIYATGGLAFINATYSNSTAVTAQQFTSGGALVAQTNLSSANSETKTRTGFALGAGVEKKIDAKWSAKLEYLYIDGGTYTFVQSSAVATSVRIRDHIARVGLNYAF
jgi:outer membrane immunogenic protein